MADTYLFAIGLCAILYWGFKVLKFCYQLWQESLWSKPVDFTKYGKWAVITGASDGIGKSIATELAKCGLNIVLISRTKSKLDKAASEMHQLSGVEVKTVAVDFTSDDTIYDVIKEEIEDLDIAVLVNNVGLAWIDPVKFLDVPNFTRFYSDSIKVNTNAMLKLTQIVLPGMVDKNKGIIVNISSLIGSRGCPYYAIYGASKSCIITYTKAMAEEYKSKGVIFQCISPAMTETPMTSHAAKSGLMIPSAEMYGRYAVKAIGKSVYTNTSCPQHNFFQRLVWMIPDAIYARLLKFGAVNALAKRNEN